MLTKPRVDVEYEGTEQTSKRLHVPRVEGLFVPAAPDNSKKYL